MYGVCKTYKLLSILSLPASSSHTLALNSLLDSPVTPQLLTVVSNLLVTLQLCHIFNRSAVFAVRMFILTDQSREIQQIDTLHGLLVNVKWRLLFPRCQLVTRRWLTVSCDFTLLRMIQSGSYWFFFSVNDCFYLQVCTQFVCFTVNTWMKTVNWTNWKRQHNSSTA